MSLFTSDIANGGRSHYISPSSTTCFSVLNFNCAVFLLQFVWGNSQKKRESLSVITRNVTDYNLCNGMSTHTRNFRGQLVHVFYLPHDRFKHAANR